MFLQIDGIPNISLRWTRPPSPLENALIGDLSRRIQTHGVFSQNSDCISWRGHGQGMFDSSSFISSLDNVVFRDVQVDPAVTKVWCGWVPPWVQFTMWLAVLGKLHTRDRLSRKGILHGDQTNCPLCNMETETETHLFLKCQHTVGLWVDACQTWKHNVIMPKYMLTFFKMWLDMPIKGRFQRRSWTAFLFATISNIWHARNRIIFEGDTWDFQRMKAQIRRQVGYWSKLWKLEHHYSPADFERAFEQIHYLDI